ncbi:hypothetical protein RND81_01G161500 [Saponaria officinalis]|uniref:Uncharacterized protein n=1 Tax=Saponaria officinalis TaxID=3572 RepID=A0AAW1NFV8_SAPOF
MFPYTIGFINEMNLGQIITDWIVSVIFLIDTSVSVFTTRTVGGVEPVLAILPTALFFQLLPRLPYLAKVWNFLRLLQVRPLLKILSELKMNQDKKMNYILKWLKREVARVLRDFFWAQESTNIAQSS